MRHASSTRVTSKEGEIVELWLRVAGRYTVGGLEARVGFGAGCDRRPAQQLREVI